MFNWSIISILVAKFMIRCIYLSHHFVLHLQVQKFLSQRLLHLPTTTRPPPLAHANASKNNQIRNIGCLQLQNLHVSFKVSEPSKICSTKKCLISPKIILGVMILLLIKLENWKLEHQLCLRTILWYGKRLFITNGRWVMLRRDGCIIC